MRHIFAFIFVCLAVVLFVLAAAKVPKCWEIAFAALSAAAAALLWP